MAANSSSAGTSPGSGPGSDRVCVGVIVGAHGIRGHVRVKSFTDDPADVAAYGPLTDDTGARTFELQVLGHSKGVVLCAIDGVTDRNDAEVLKNVRLYVERDRLPPADGEDEFYHADLIGLGVELRDGTKLGAVVAVFDFGAGDVLEVRAENGATTMVPFTKEAVPEVDLAAGKVVAEKLPGLVEGAPEAPKQGKARRSGVPGPHEGAPSEGESLAPDDEWPDEDWR